MRIAKNYSFMLLSNIAKKIIAPPIKTPNGGISLMNIHAQIGAASASEKAKIPILAEGVVLEPKVKQIKPGAYCRAPKKKTKIKSCNEIAIGPLKKNPAAAAKIPETATAGTISIVLNVRIRVTIIVNPTGMTKAKAFPSAVPPDILVPIMI